MQATRLFRKFHPLSSTKVEPNCEKIHLVSLDVFRADFVMVARLVFPIGKVILYNSVTCIRLDRNLLVADSNVTIFSFHLLPSGLVNPDCVNLIGSAVVFHVPSFFKELQDLHEKGLDTTDRILVSDRCQVSFDLHAAVDGLEEVEVSHSVTKTPW